MALKKFFGILCLLAFIVLPINRLEATPRVAVIPFDNQSARQNTAVESILETARSNVEIDIVRTGRFDSLDRTQIQKLLEVVFT